jgi:hypothetical protein
MKKILIFLLLMILVFSRFAFAEVCPPKTTPGRNYIDFVGKLDGLGGDEKVIVWFEYGLKKESLDKKTKELELREPKIFCLREKNLKPCTVYYYRAAAKNSAGTNYGEIKSIKTLCKDTSSKNNKSDKKNILKWIIF